MFWVTRWFERKLAGTKRRQTPKRLAPQKLSRSTVRLAAEELEVRVVPANTVILQQSPQVTTQIFPANYPTNTPIVNAPVAANSTTVINQIAASQPTVFVNFDNYDSTSNAQAAGMFYNVVHSTDTVNYSMVKVYLDNYPGESDVSGSDKLTVDLPGGGTATQTVPYVLVPMPKSQSLLIEGDNQNGTPDPGRIGNNDSHLIIYDADTGLDYEFWMANRPNETALAVAAGDLDQVVPNAWNAANEATFNTSPNVGNPIPAPATGTTTNPTSSFRAIGLDSGDAAGLSILENIATPDQGLPAADGGQGVINHAIRFTLQKNFIEGGEFTYPGNHVTSGSGTLPYGTRFRLNPNAPGLSALVGQMGPESQAFVTAMETYGLILSDIGSNMFVQSAEVSMGTNNSPLIDPSTGQAMTWNMNDLLGMGTFSVGLSDIPTADFQIVNMTPVVTSITSSTGSAGSTITIKGANFAGSGGNLKVLFAPLGGTSAGTASPTVTFVSDTQITAVVPAGSGTVDVRVVSGYTGTAAQDNQNGNGENVLGNAYPGGGPIYGYGVSATLAADQFTYSSVTVSGTNSSVSIASPTVAAGLTDTVTIVVKDTSNNPVTGLNSSSFSFGLSGGTSTGSFGTFTATATPGTYTEVFTGTTAGTLSTLSVSVSGVAIAAPPSVTVTAAVLKSIAVTPANPTVAKGLTQQFTATGTFSDGTTQNLTGSVTWASATTSAATISAAGLASAVGTAGQTSVISATQAGITGSTTLKVGAATLSSIAVTPTVPSVAKGTTQQFTATGTFSDGTTQNLTATVTWASATTSAATITAAGLATAVGTVGQTSVISATQAGISGSTTLKVAAATLSSIGVTPANPSVAKGTTQQFTATGTFSDGTTQNLTATVTWASATTSVATITAGGLASAVGAAGQTSVISATQAGISGSTTLKVTAAALTSIVVTPINPSVAKGATQQFTATGTFSDGTTQNLTGSVTWVSATTSVATITAAGVATAVGAVGQTSVITATQGSVSGTTTLKVSAATVSSIAVTPANPSVAKGLTQQFTATGTFSDGTTQNLTATVTWASATTSVATITAAGLASAVSTGTSLISATQSGVSGSTTLTVAAATLSSIAVTPTTPSIAKGTTQQFTATGTFSDGTTQNLTGSVTWASATTSVATITAAGLATAVGAAGQTSLISATQAGISGNTTLKVSAATLSSIAVTPANPSVAKGTTQQFVVTGTFSDGTTQNLTATVTWASATTSVATITTAGLASAVGAVGQTSVISATQAGISGNTTLKVGAATLSSIAVTPASPSIAKGTTQQFTATGTFSDGTTQNLTGTVTWASATTSAATITAGGLASAVGAVGTTSVISATQGGVSGTTTLTVSAATLSSIAVTPTTPSLGVGLIQQFTATGTFSDGTTQNLTASVTWASATTSAATITVAGLATAVGAAGSTSVISATQGVVAGSTTLTVVAGATISPTNSTVTTVSSIVGPGGKDTITIVVKDTGGNPVSGLSSGAFSFSLTGGTSAGTFGSVTETATPGTYTVAFSATTAGTVSTLNTTVGGVSLTTKPTIFVSNGLDVDANGTVDPLTDGVLILRYLFGFSGTTLTTGAIGAGATRTDPVAIANYLLSMKTTMLDADGNGTADPLTDGVLIMRYMFGFTGSTLISGAVNAGGTRTTAVVIQAYLDSYNPTLAHEWSEGVGSGVAASERLTAPQLQAVTAEAITRWEAAGITADQKAKLLTAQVQLANLGGNVLGQTHANDVLIDESAAGYGWYVDSSADNSAFEIHTGNNEWSASAGSLASGRIDLLTVVMHELGLVMGLQEFAPSVLPNNIMTSVLPTGVRRLP